MFNLLKNQTEVFWTLHQPLWGSAYSIKRSRTEQKSSLFYHTDFSDSCHPDYIIRQVFGRVSPGNYDLLKKRDEKYKWLWPIVHIFFLIKHLTFFFQPRLYLSLCIWAGSYLAIVPSLLCLWGSESDLYSQHAFTQDLEWSRGQI